MQNEQDLYRALASDAAVRALLRIRDILADETLSDDALPQSHALTGRERFERCVYRRQPGALRAVWSAGRKVYEAE